MVHVGGFPAFHCTSSLHVTKKSILTLFQTEKRSRIYTLYHKLAWHSLIHQHCNIASNIKEHHLIMICASTAIFCFIPFFLHEMIASLQNCCMLCRRFDGSMKKNWVYCGECRCCNFTDWYQKGNWGTFEWDCIQYVTMWCNWPILANMI